MGALILCHVVLPEESSKIMENHGEIHLDIVQMSSKPLLVHDWGLIVLY